jgi:hypothetical protein
MDQLPWWAHYVQALGPTVVAVIAALFALYIGLRQWKTAHDRLTFDLYEKRFAVYEATKNFLNTVRYQEQVTGEDYTALYNGIRGAEFLVDRATRSYLTTIAGMAWKAQTIRTKLVDHPNHPQADKLFEEEERILEFLLEQGKTLETMFGPYLDLSKVGLKSYWPW